WSILNVPSSISGRAPTRARRIGKGAFVPCPFLWARLSPNRAGLARGKRDDGPADSSPRQAGLKKQTHYRKRQCMRSWPHIFLHVTGLVCLLEGSDRVSFGNELVTEVTVVAGGDNSAADGRVIEFLLLVQIVAARHPGGVVVADVPAARPDRGDHITLHDLHV